MPGLRKVFGVTAALAWLGGAYAKLDLNSADNVVVYWGQNSVESTGNGEQKRLSYYCEDQRIDVVILAFVKTISGKGGAPVIDLGNISQDCKTIPGTNLKKCPQMEDDIKTCQKNNKTVLLSIGGEAYREGGFRSADDAMAGADMIWKMFGPVKGNYKDLPSGSAPHTAYVTSVKPQPTTGSQQSYNQPASNQATNGYDSQDSSGYGSQGSSGYGSQGTNGNQQSWNIYGRSLDARTENKKSKKTYRPFGKASVDGIDLDFESANSYMGPFANRLRQLMDADSHKRHYLTAAPQCPYPDVADKDFLNGPNAAHMDAVWVQFYNNPCGLDGFKPKGGSQNNFNFKTWDNWAKKGSKNKDVKIFLGVPASNASAFTGFVPASDLKPIIDYSGGFDSFGGVMMWDVGQAYANKGFLGTVSKDLGGVSTRSLSSRTLVPNAGMVLGVLGFGCLYLMI